MPFGQMKGERMDDDAIAKKIINNHLPPVINQCTHARISEATKLGPPHSLPANQQRPKAFSSNTLSHSYFYSKLFSRDSYWLIFTFGQSLSKLSWQEFWSLYFFMINVNGIHFNWPFRSFSFYGSYRFG